MFQINTTIKGYTIEKVNKSKDGDWFVGVISGVFNVEKGWIRRIKFVTKTEPKPNGTLSGTITYKVVPYLSDDGSLKFKVEQTIFCQ